MSDYAYANYQQSNLGVRTSGATSVQLMIVLLEALQDELARLCGHVEQQRFQAKGASINRCMDMFAALVSSLDFESGVEAVDHLARLYEYCMSRLNQAGFAMDVGMVEEVSGLMAPILQAWRTVEARGA